MSERREPKPIALRCECGAQVNVVFRQEFAKCSTCGRSWRWKKCGKRMTFGLRDQVAFASVQRKALVR